MKRTLAVLLSLALLSAPALSALAEENSPIATPTALPEAGAAATPEASPEGVPEVELLPQEATPTPTPVETPALPEGKTGEPPKDAPQVQAPAEPGLPEKAAKERESAFKMKNFALGFLGGALLGGALGVLLFSSDDKGFNTEKAKTMGPLGAGIGGLSFGLAAYLLGSTTPEELKPPDLDEEGALPGAQPVAASPGLRFNWAF